MDNTSEYSNNSLENLSDSSSESCDSPLENSKSNKLPTKIYENIEEFLSFASQNKKIKILLECSPINQFYSLKDISLHKKGPLEDKLYANNPIYYKNIRRGNTILEIYEPNNSIPIEKVFCRRGLLKFYDLSLDIIEFTKNSKKTKFLTKMQKKIQKIIFENIETLPSDSFKNVAIYKIYKENGEHCQIGYIKTIDCWLIASKNVTILVRCAKDLEFYIKERHYWPKIIAETWFHYLDTLPLEKLNELKMTINGFTLLGEHCGNPKHTHIIEYKKIDIIFYAIVENNNPRIICQDPLKAFALFKTFGLNTSRIEVFKDFCDLDGFINKIDDLLREIERSGVEKEGEGAVVYISHKEEVISMCKMKTIEYLIFRDLREHLKKQVTKPNIQRILKYNEGVRTSMEGKIMEKSKEFYLELGKTAFDYIHENKTSFKEVYYNFVDLLKKCLAQTTENFKDSKKTESNKKISNFQIIIISPPLFFGLDTNEILIKNLKIDKIQNVWREEFEIKEGLSVYNLISNTPKLTGKGIFQDNKHFIIIGFSKTNLKKCIEHLAYIEKSGLLSNFSSLTSIIKSKEKKEVFFDKFSNKIPSFIETLKIFGLKYTHFNEEEVKVEDFIMKIKDIYDSKSIEKTSLKYEKELIILLPIGVPGMGKSYFSSILLKLMKNYENVGFFTLSIDEIRAGIPLSMNTGEDTQHYKKTAKETNKRFFEKFEEILKKIVSEENYDKNILYVDKNHTPTIHEKTIDIITKTLKPFNVKLQLYCLVPQNIKGKVFRIKDFQYPFSREFIIACLMRCMNREGHQTLDQDPIYRVKVFLKFLQIYRNEKLKEMDDLDGFIEIPFVNEEEYEGGNYDRLMDLIGKALEMIQPKCNPLDSPIFLEVVEEFYHIFGNIEEKESNSIMKDKKEEVNNLIINEKIKSLLL